MLGGLQRVARHAIYDLRGGFLVRPLAIALLLAVLGAALPQIEAGWTTLHDDLLKLPVLVPRDPATAQSMLSITASAVMTVASIVLSVLLVALTLASMQFSPRILAGFVEDRTNQRTIGLFLGTFLYCLCAYPSVHVGPPAVVPMATVLGAVALAMACVGWLLVFIQHIARSINASFIADRIARETEEVIDEVLPEPLDGRLPTEDTPLGAPIDGNKILATTSGYVRFIDEARLVALTKRLGTFARVERRVGQYVPEGVSLLRLATRRELDEATTAEFVDIFDVGPMRTLEQDIEFGVLQLVDIALKAISPAVNDPSTAINCIDQLSRLLVRVSSRRAAKDALYLPPGVVRVALSPVTFPRLLEAAFAQIRHYGKGDVAVSCRLLRALADVATTANDPRQLEALREETGRLSADCKAAMPESEFSAIEERAAAVLRLIEAKS